MLTLLGINKILAIYVGPSGYAAIGQFQNAMQIITTFASGAVNTGVTKYTAEYYEDEERQRAVWRTAGTIALIGSIGTGMLVALFSKSLAVTFLNDESYGSVFVWFSITLVLLVLNSLLLAILNGKKEIQRYVAANISGSFFALITTGILTGLYGLKGALIALSVYQSLTFFATIFFCHQAAWFKLIYLFGQIEKPVAINLVKYTAMALTSAACVPVSHLLVRNHLGEALGWNVAGYWDAMWRLSTAYLMLITSTLSVYYLPRFSELQNIQQLKQEIIQGYKIILPVVMFCALNIYLMRDFIIHILFTKDFAPMRELFAWQMTGDVLKIGGWIIAYIMIGRAMVKLFILTEIVFSFSFVLLSYIFIYKIGMTGVVVAYTMNYFFYWVKMIFFARKLLFTKN